MATASVPKISRAVPIKNLFFVTDFALASRLAMPYVVALAARYKARVTLVHALGAIPFTPIPFEPLPEIDERPRQLVLPQMEELRKEFAANNVDVKLALKDGELTQVIDSELKEENADLVVLGTHAHGGFHRLLMGSHAEHILRHAKCGVMLVGPRAEGAARWRDRIARILLATNFEVGSEHALSYITPIAEEHHSEVTLLHVVDEPVSVPLDAAELAMHRATDRLAEFAAKTDLSCPMRLETKLGHPHQEIVACANQMDADLIVLGRRPGGFFSEHKAATTITLTAGLARCPVLTLC